MSSNLPASNYVDIAADEYMTKYSLNRNFEKLLSNDNYLYDMYDADATLGMDTDERLKHIQTFNTMKTYNAGEFVFYKISKDDTKFYVLSSAQTANTHKPAVRKNAYTNELYVVNSDWWTIVGINPTKGSGTPLDRADMYMNDKHSLFESTHELNTSPENHPTGKLSLQSSSKLFKSFQNISEDRKALHYPSYLQSFVSDNTTYYGHMRKWDNGILEYDLTFRLGYISSDAQGIDVISANNLVLQNRNQNFMYFKDKSDYQIFNQGGEGYVATQQTLQVNLNNNVNAYAGKISFIEPFKDLNYMVFTSGMKSIDVEARDLKNDSIPEHDNRLVVEGLAIAGVKPGADFSTPCIIPDEAVSIGKYALANVKQYDDNKPLVFSISQESKLVDIDQYAFEGNDILSICIPSSVRHIGSNAFSSCNKLSSISFYVSYDIASQVRIDKNAFNTNIKKIQIVYVDNVNDSFTSQSNQDITHEYVYLANISLYQKLKNPDYRAFIGLDSTNIDAVEVKVSTLQ